MLAAAWTVYSEKGTIVLSNEKVIAKIQKLFARKESNFAAEAETALLMAQKLMLQHNISIADIHRKRRRGTALLRILSPETSGARLCGGSRARLVKECAMWFLLA